MSTSLDVLQQLLPQHHQFVGFLERRVGPTAAEDILQAAYVRVLERDASPRDDAARLGWFYRVLRNALIDHVRMVARRERLSRVFVHEHVATTDAEPDSGEIDGAARCARHLVETLPAPQREAIDLVYLQDGSISDLARTRGITRNSAAVRVHRARAALRSQLQRCEHSRL